MREKDRGRVGDNTYGIERNEGQGKRGRTRKIKVEVENDTCGIERSEGGGGERDRERWRMTPML